MHYTVIPIDFLLQTQSYELSYSLSTDIKLSSRSKLSILEANKLVLTIIQSTHEACASPSSNILAISLPRRSNSLDAISAHESE